MSGPDGSQETEATAFNWFCDLTDAVSHGVPCPSRERGTHVIWKSGPGADSPSHPHWAPGVGAASPEPSLPSQPLRAPGMEGPHSGPPTNPQLWGRPRFWEGPWGEPLLDRKTGGRFQQLAQETVGQAASQRLRPPVCETGARISQPRRLQGLTGCEHGGKPLWVLKDDTVSPPPPHGDRGCPSLGWSREGGRVQS